MEEKGIENKIRDFPGSPVVKILPFIAGGASSISGLVPGRGAEIPRACHEVRSLNVVVPSLEGDRGAYPTTFRGKGVRRQMPRCLGRGDHS